MIPYQQFGQPFPVLRLQPRKWINDAHDPDYPAFAAWVAAGNTPLDGSKAADVPPIVRLAMTDPWMGRIGEDMFAVLLAKGIIALTDLPPITQQKIQQRQQLRSQLSTGV